MSKKYCITFAGVPGSSKSTIASYLSIKLGLPVFTNDMIRAEVHADLLEFDQDEYLKRRDERLKELIDGGNSFIFDASVDRSWDTIARQWLADASYEIYIISMDLSRELIAALYKVKNYTNNLDLVMAQHKTFLENHGDQVNLAIADKDFSNRLNLAFEAASAWIRSL